MRFCQQKREIFVEALEPREEDKEKGGHHGERKEDENEAMQGTRGQEGEEGRQVAERGWALNH